MSVDLDLSLEWLVENSVMVLRSNRLFFRIFEMVVGKFFWIKFHLLVPN